DPMANSGKVILFLLLIVGLIVFLAWLINKTRATQFGLGQAQLRTIAMLSLGTKEKVAIIEAGGKHLVIGVTPHQITLLSELNEKIEQTPAATLGFAEILKKAVTK
ncbi:MAG: flagellar biosynthetic protein FliO, partial [Oleibacter sp.]|nr:flagellar biosynthetic protein FliO [Thalassolituus sp.]